MRGWDVKSEALFSYVNCEARVPKDHPLRPIRRIVDEALGALSPEFEQLYAKFGRPSIPPERLLRTARDPLRRRMDSDSPWPVSQRGQC
jgi:transposase